MASVNDVTLTESSLAEAALEGVYNQMPSSDHASTLQSASLSLKKICIIHLHAHQQQLLKIIIP